MHAFRDPPAVILAARTARVLKVNLLEQVLADIADVEVAGQAVEGEAPGVAQAERPDFGPVGRLRDEGIGGRDGVGLRAAGFDIEAENLAEQLRGILRVVVGVAA